MNEKILHIFDHSIPLHSGYTFRSQSIVMAQRAAGWRTAHVTSSKHALADRERGSASEGTRSGQGGGQDGGTRSGTNGDTNGDTNGGTSGRTNRGTTSRPNGVCETVEGLVFHRTSPGRLAGLPLLEQWDVVRELAPRIRQVARAEGSEVLHAHSPSLNGLAALRAARSLGIPVVYEVRAFWEDAAVDHGTAAENGTRYRLTRALETHVLRRADEVTCICEGLRSEIIARGIPPGKVTVIPNAVDISRFPMLAERDAALEARLGLQGRKVLGFIGSFYAYEGLDLMLDALPAIVRRLPDARLLLVGGGPQQEALAAQAGRLGLQDHVIFTGRVPHAQVQAYSSLVDAFVFPRKSMRLTELVTPLKPLEAMAQGRVVLASDVGGHRELIEHRRTGFLFRQGDAEDLARTAVETLTAAPERMAAVIREARAFVEGDRNWQASVSRYRGVYERALRRAA